MSVPTNTVTTEQESPIQPATKSRRWHAWLIALVLLIVPLIVFQHVRTQDFVRYDDNDHVYNNPYLNPVTTSNVLHFWQAPYHKLYIPLSYTIYALVAEFAHAPADLPQTMDVNISLDPHIFHIASLIVHILNIGLVYAILLLLLRKIRRDSPLARSSNWPAVIGALLFGIHPVQVESVAWISELRGLLCGAACLGTIWLALRRAEADLEGARPRAMLRALSIAAPIVMILAVLCKPTAVTVPLMVLALDHWALGRTWRKCLVSASPLLAISAAFAVITQIIQPPVASVVYPLWERPFVAGDALAFYLQKLVFPRDLGIIYQRTPEYVMKHWWGFATWLIPAALGILVWRRRKSSPWLLAACGISLAALLPVLGLVQFLFQHFSTVADRYLYLAMLGPAFAVTWILAKRPSAITLFGCCLVLAIFGGMSIAQTRTWDNTNTLWLNEVKVNPYRQDIYDKLATMLGQQGKTADEITVYQADLRYNPDDLDARFGLAILLMESDRAMDAIPVFEEFIRRVPDAADAHYGLATALYQVGVYNHALSEYREAVRVQPDSAKFHATLGTALASFGKRREAVAELREAVRLQPDYAAARRALEKLLKSGPR